LIVRKAPEPTNKNTSLGPETDNASRTPKMATYEPLPFPQRPKSPSLAASICYQAQLMYYRYEINTGLYVMSPGEKSAFNLVNLTIATLLLSVVYYFLPLSLVGFAQRLVGGAWQSLSSGGEQEREMQGALLQGLLPGEWAATLREGGMEANASMVALPGMF
jgi:hypothetical protein